MYACGLFLSWVDGYLTNIKTIPPFIHVYLTCDLLWFCLLEEYLFCNVYMSGTTKAFFLFSCLFIAHFCLRWVWLFILSFPFYLGGFIVIVQKSTFFLVIREHCTIKEYFFKTSIEFGFVSTSHVLFVFFVSILNNKVIINTIIFKLSWSGHTWRHYNPAIH